jgi:hypothetical protein
MSANPKFGLGRHFWPLLIQLRFESCRADTHLTCNPWLDTSHWRKRAHPSPRTHYLRSVSPPALRSGSQLHPYGRPLQNHSHVWSNLRTYNSALVVIIKRNLERMMSKQGQKSRQGEEAQSASHGACTRLSCAYGTTDTLNMDGQRLGSRVRQAIVLNYAFALGAVPTLHWRHRNFRVKVIGRLLAKKKLFNGAIGIAEGSSMDNLGRMACFSSPPWLLSTRVILDWETATPPPLTNLLLKPPGRQYACLNPLPFYLNLVSQSSLGSRGTKFICRWRMGFGRHRPVSLSCWNPGTLR